MSSSDGNAFHSEHSPSSVRQRAGCTHTPVQALGWKHTWLGTVWFSRLQPWPLWAPGTRQVPVAWPLDGDLNRCGASINQLIIWLISESSLMKGTFWTEAGAAQPKVASWRKSCTQKAHSEFSFSIACSANMISIPRTRRCIHTISFNLSGQSCLQNSDTQICACGNQLTKHRLWLKNAASNVTLS